MKANRFLKLKTNLILVLGAAALTGPALGETISYSPQPGSSKATVYGDSSIKKWNMESGIIGGKFEADANFPESALTDPAAAKPVAQVSIPVKTLKTGNATMEGKMQVTMSETNFPRIIYNLIELKPKSKPGATGALAFDAIGTLTITGKTITNTMPVTIEKTAGKLKIVGSTPLKLTQFDIKPPIIALPLLPDITVYDDLKVDFVWALAPKKK